MKPVPAPHASPRPRFHGYGAAEGWRAVALAALTALAATMLLPAERAHAQLTQAFVAPQQALLALALFGAEAGALALAWRARSRPDTGAVRTQHQRAAAWLPVLAGATLLISIPVWIRGAHLHWGSGPSSREILGLILVGVLGGALCSVGWAVLARRQAGHGPHPQGDRSHVPGSSLTHLPGSLTQAFADTWSSHMIRVSSPPSGTVGPLTSGVPRDFRADSPGWAPLLLLVLGSLVAVPALHKLFP